MNKIIRKVRENFGMFVFLLVSYAAFLSLLNPMVLGLVGVGAYAGLCGVVLLIDMLVFCMALSDQENVFYFVWFGLAFHLLGFLVFYLETNLFGWWGKPFEWEAELGHGNFSNEVSPASCWNYLCYIAAARVVLQPLYLLIIKIKHRR